VLDVADFAERMRASRKKNFDRTFNLLDEICAYALSKLV